VSPLATESAKTEVGQIITVTPEALQELVTLRDSEPEGDRLGLRLEIVSNPGEDFKYDLSFDIVTKAAFSDEVRTHTRPEIGSLKVIIAASAMDLLEGATLDHTATQGLVIRNPNKPKAPSVEGLISNDALSAEVEALIKGEVAEIEAIEADPTGSQAALNTAIGELTGKPLADTTIQAAFGNIEPTWDPLASTINTIADNGLEAGTLTEKPDLNGIYDLTALNKVLAAAGKPPVSAAGLGQE